eukprot:TRINITY_DN2018_c0_g1_i2.p1 TRINITY_DN2018_c0_g1~~TRINITY_DN2018_c0_g1_i2.p1  ORF type:complete len:106 (-),score=22.22 TRINITY_DN2018_c0_g1_i2:164-481(-)
MDSFITPRVNKSYLSSFVGNTVRLVGKVINQNSGTAVLESSDHQQVQVYQQQGSHYADEFVEVIGKVNPDGTIREEIFYNWGSNFDLDLYNEAIQEYHKHRELFF